MVKTSVNFGKLREVVKGCLTMNCYITTKLLTTTTTTGSRSSLLGNGERGETSSKFRSLYQNPCVSLRYLFANICEVYTVRNYIWKSFAKVPEVA